MKELATVALILAVPFGARAVLEIAHYRMRGRRDRITWGRDSIGLPAPLFFGLACGLGLAATALLVVIGMQYGGTGIFEVVFFTVCALVLIVAMTAYYVFRAKSIARLGSRPGKQK